MKKNKREVVRLIVAPLAFIAVVLFALLMPTGARYISTDDILSVRITSASGDVQTIESRAGVEAFARWLNLTVPPEDMCFVKESDAMQLDGADLSMVADQVPAKMQGLDDADSFVYSIYHMYVYVKDQELYYNGVLYEITPAAIQAIDNIGGGT